MRYTQVNNNHILKDGRKVKGYVSKLSNGYGYSFGKPSDNTVIMFSKNEGHYNLDEAKNKLTSQLY